MGVFVVVVLVVMMLAVVLGLVGVVREIDPGHIHGWVRVHARD